MPDKIEEVKSELLKKKSVNNSDENKVEEIAGEETEMQAQEVTEPTKPSLEEIIKPIKSTGQKTDKMSEGEETLSEAYPKQTLEGEEGSAEERLSQTKTPVETETPSSHPQSSSEGIPEDYQAPEAGMTVQENIDQVNENAQVLARRYIDETLDIKRMREKQAEDVEVYAQDLRRSRDEIEDKAFNKVEKQSVIVKGETFNNLLKIAIVGVLGGGLDSVQKEFDKEYDKKLKDKDEALSKFVDLTSKIFNADIAKKEYIAQGTQAYLNGLTALAESDKNLLANEKFRASYEQSQKENERANETLDLSKKQFAFTQSSFEWEKKYKNKQLSLSRVNAQINLLKEMNKQNEGLSGNTDFRNFRIPNGLQVKVNIPTGKMGSANAKLITEVRGSIASAQRMNETYTNLQSVVGELKQITSGFGGTFKAGWASADWASGTFETISGNPDKTRALFREFYGLITSMYATGKDTLGLGRLTDEDRVILDNFLGNLDPNNVKMSQVRPSQLNEVMKRIDKLYKGNLREIVAKGNLSIGGKYITSEQELESVLFSSKAQVNKALGKPEAQREDKNKKMNELIEKEKKLRRR